MSTPVPNKKLFLLDAMALIYRAHFAFLKTPRINSRGESTGATFGFVNTLLEIIQKEKPTHIGVAFDTDVPTFRHEQYEAYKANRQAQPEDIALAIPLVIKILEGFNIPILMVDGFEADDVIGTLAWNAADDGFEVFMMTPDKDYGQLVREHVYLYKPSYMGRGVDVLGVKEICERWDIQRPEQVCDILGLMGDAVDNVPGIPGIGEKTAIKLIKEYDTVENLLDNAHHIKGKVGENLLAFAEQGRLSKKLICIDTKVPIPFDAEGLLIGEPNKEAITQIFEQLEFRTMLGRLFPDLATAKTPKLAAKPSINGSAQLDLFSQQSQNLNTEVIYRDGNTTDQALNAPRFSPPSEPRSIDHTLHTYHAVISQAQRSELCSYLLSQNEFCFDTETDALDPHAANLVGISFCCVKNEAYYIPVPADPTEAQRVVDDFRPLFINPDILKIGQNLKYDISVLANYNLNVVGPFYDTMLAHYLIEPEQRHGMDFLAQNYLNYTPIPIEALIGPKATAKSKPQLTMRDVALADVVEYAAEDADITYQLKQLLAPEITAMQLDSLLMDVEGPLMDVLADMERTGINVDISALAELSILLEGEARIAEEKIYADAGERFNIGSPQQLGIVLFEKLKIDSKPRLTPTGQYATGEDILSRLAPEHQIAADILEFRQIQKLKSTYIDALPQLRSPRDGRVHTSYNQAVAATGRLSSTNPNLQNIPIRTNRGKEIRKAFVAKDANHRIISADYSQIELRIMASFSEDETMMEAFRQGKDIHQITASRIYKIDLDDVTGDMRRKAKTANFGIIYGISAFGLSQRLNIPRQEASDLIKAYFVEFPAVKSYMDSCVALAREQEYVTTQLGRRRYLRDINSRNATQKGFAERNAINAPIQGTAADMIKIAMVRIFNYLETEKLATKMILQVHDELVFDAPLHEIEIIKEPIMRHMSEALLLKVPIEVGWGVGHNWLEAH
jgi:DNA polymerase I